MDQSATAPLIRYTVSYCRIVWFSQGSGVYFCPIVRSILGPDVCNCLIVRFIQGSHVCYCPIVRFIQGSDVCYCAIVRAIQGSHVCYGSNIMFHSRILCLLVLPEGQISDIYMFLFQGKRHFQVFWAVKFNNIDQYHNSLVKGIYLHIVLIMEIQRILVLRIIYLLNVWMSGGCVVSNVDVVKW